MPRYGLGSQILPWLQWHGQADSFARQRLSQHSARGVRVEWELGDLDSIVAVGGMEACICILRPHLVHGPWSSSFEQRHTILHNPAIYVLRVGKFNLGK
jgi:hypothetical protein